MANIYTVQAVFISTQGRMYKSQPKELREGLDLDDYKLGLRSDLRMGQYPIEFVNENGHEQLLMPDKVETIIFNILGVRPEHSFQEPQYEALRQQWQADLKQPEAAEDPKPAAVQPVVPVAPGSASSTSLIPSSDKTVVYKYGGPRTPDPKIYDMANEETQEMPLPKVQPEPDKDMAIKAVERTVSAAAPKPGPGKAFAGAREARSSQRGGRSGKLPRS